MRSTTRSRKSKSRRSAGWDARSKLRSPPWPNTTAATAPRTRRAKASSGDASDALWCFMVQREAFGLRDPRPVIRDYRVPAEVHNRMGAFGRR